MIVVVKALRIDSNDSNSRFKLMLRSTLNFASLSKCCVIEAYTWRHWCPDWLYKRPPYSFNPPLQQTLTQHNLFKDDYVDIISYQAQQRHD